MMFLVQHYPHRVQHIFQKAGATPQQYQQVLQLFNKRAGHHFTEVNRRNLATIRQQTPAEIQSDVERLPITNIHITKLIPSRFCP
eukprot:5482713-Amphidinium_carterae.1